MSIKREIRKIFKISNNIAVVIPPNIANEFEIKEGDYVSIKLEKDKLILKKNKVNSNIIIIQNSLLMYLYDG